MSIALAAAVAVSPYYALYTLKSVVVHGDADALAERVNFPVLRENIKEKLRGEIAKQTVQRSGADGTTTDGLNALGVMLGSQFINLAIDQYVNPQFVIQMVQDSSRTHGDNARVPYVASSGYQGINKFYAQIKVPDQAESIGLIFRRSGLLGWQLTDIDLNEIFNAGAPVANTETTRPAPTREWQTPRIDKAITPSSHNAGTMQLVNVPFVGCQSDGQTGPVEAPRAETKAVMVPGDQAGFLAYYKAEAAPGVLGPRDWACFGTYGSSGNTLYVSPDPIDSTLVFSSAWQGFTGPAIQITQEFGDTSGRFGVARIIRRIFPAHMSFATRVLRDEINEPGSGPPSPYPDDKLSYESNEVVEYTTPPQREGLGTNSRLIMSREPISGAAILVGSTPDLVMVSVRLPRDVQFLTNTIIRESVREAGHLVK